jgi:two-component system cell cycle response regulator DivK
MTTVLIVEDDENNLLVFSLVLTKRGGLQVKSTEDVEEVIQLASSGEIDLILMDVALSQSIYQGQPVDGIQITQILKSNPVTAKLPVILVTAHAMEGYRQKFLEESGADDYITKPILDQQAFVERIKKLIETTKSGN